MSGISGGIRRALREVQSRLPPAKGATVFAYHLVQGGTASPVDLSLPCFRHQLAQIATRVEDLVEPKEVVLTFDDAYANFYEFVWPLLREHSLPATLYVPYDFVDGHGRAPITGTDHLPPCTWGQLREMVSEGLSIGSHSITHRNLRRLSLAEARREIVDSKGMLEDKLGVSVETFCYPQAKWNRKLERIVRETYKTAVVGGGTKYRPGKTPPWRIPRVSIRRDMPADLTPILQAPVVLEEWLGDLTRRFRR